MSINVLSIAGSDPSGGAGIQADIKAISANGGYAMAAITALTAQNTTGVQAVMALENDFVVQQLRSIFDDIRVDAIKIGMIANADIAYAIADTLRHTAVPHVVIDPVMVAKGGDRLLDPTAVNALRTELLPLATIVTPNLPEAACLSDRPMIKSRDEMSELAQALQKLGVRGVLLKGGHLEDDDGSIGSPDLFVLDGQSHWFEAPRHATKNTHGTGCTLSSALAALLPQYDDPAAAVKAAKDYISGAIAKADALTVGHGHGPTHHFWRGTTGH